MGCRGRRKNFHATRAASVSFSSSSSELALPLPLPPASAMASSQASLNPRGQQRREREGGEREIEREREGERDLVWPCRNSSSNLQPTTDRWDPMGPGRTRPDPTRAHRTPSDPFGPDQASPGARQGQVRGERILGPPWSRAPAVRAAHASARGTRVHHTLTHQRYQIRRIISDDIQHHVTASHRMS